MSAASRRGLSPASLIVACCFGVVALTSAADARPATRTSYPQGVTSFGDSEFASLHMRSAYASSRRSVTRPQATRVASLEPTVASGGSSSSGSSSSLVAEARRWVGTNPTGRSSLWCGHFMNFVLSRTGHRVHNSNLARSFASYGRHVSGPQVGAIAVMSRGAYGGHVGIVTGVDRSGNPIIISGNVSKRVEEIPFPRSRILAYVMP
jgi:uncharacterized protein (TIGR02594 family)